MILHPSIIALLVSSLLMSILTLYAGYFAVLIIKRWDINSGSSLQLDLERRTYLISTILAYVFGFQLISFFLFIYTADSLSTLFTGAMCAAGTLNLNRFGYPLLFLKLSNFIFAGLWLILNYTDNRGYDYPLIRKKYWFLLFLAPLLISDTILQAQYFLSLHPDVITSCCGSLFSGSETAAADLSAVPQKPMKVIFGISLFSVAAGAGFFYKTGRGGYLLSLLSAAALPVFIASILSFISPYIYELPSHHCPFCLLQKEYGYLGYLLYLMLLAGTVSGIGAGLLAPFKNRSSLAAVIPPLQKKFALATVFAYSALAVVVLYRIFTSHLVM